MPAQNGSENVYGEKKAAVKKVDPKAVVKGKVDPKLAAKGKVDPKTGKPIKLSATPIAEKKTVAPVAKKGAVQLDKKGNPIKGVKPLIKKADASIGPTAINGNVIHGTEKQTTNPYPYADGKRDPVMGVGDGFDDVVRSIESLSKLCR